MKIVSPFTRFGSIIKSPPKTKDDVNKKQKKMQKCVMEHAPSI